MIRLVLIAAASAVAISGAALAAPITDEQLATLKPGVTTYDDVLGQFGKPTTVETDADGSKAITYVRTRTHVKAATFVPIVGLFAGGAVGKSDSEKFEFDAAGKLTKTTTSQTEIECRTFGGCGNR